MTVDITGDDVAGAEAVEGNDNTLGTATDPSAIEADSSSSDITSSDTEEKKAGNLEWFVVRAYSGFEFKVKQSLEERIRLNNMGHLFGDIHVPQEKVEELVRGQKKVSNRKFFPGYVLVQMVLNEDSWHLVKETPKVSGFAGDATAPSPMSPDEVARILEQVQEGVGPSRMRMNFEQGETVKVIDGPFTDFSGTIEEVKPDKGKIKVLISIFGRATPVELDFVQVEKS